MTNKSFESIIPPQSAYDEPTYGKLVQISAKWFVKYFSHHRTEGWGLGKNTRILLENINPESLLLDIGYSFLGAFLITLIRLFISKRIENFFVSNKLLTPRSFIRFMESFYVCVVTALSWTWAVMLERKLGYLTNPAKLWIDFDIFTPVPSCVWWLYQLEVAHYMHSIYAVIWINPWNRKDSYIMLTHHLFALLLLSVSYFTHTHYLGILVICCHDICDVFIEGCKCMIKLTPQTGFYKNVVETVKITFFLSVLVSWSGLRLYLFPLNVIYPAGVYLMTNSLALYNPVDGILFGLLWLIVVLNVYWAFLIIGILINTLRGGSGEIEDVRDFDEMQEKKQMIKQQKSQKNKSKKTN